MEQRCERICKRIMRSIVLITEELGIDHREFRDEVGELSHPTVWILTVIMIFNRTGYKQTFQKLLFGIYLQQRLFLLSLGHHTVPLHFGRVYHHWLTPHNNR